ncbi:bifunctional 4-hydroxy-2-oxoglutarate aldolase/2-dehydro-3-deoxy-phosphogluconate aldolase [Leucobacter celer]|uniref:bifunctional 4-hydroxy-2-oxoglutarate aldolase/2-dehydro-3-deoxy-phosphogluconate aldolase n=1 Tax=Leucobacter celer TaxID=668625 RepID=UPI0006A7EE4B|nr:bifunctional 4-hydroxy-2-oxoglutarate aldolase/2-dehydro-3-deoxy-phosphogluconate aldolase [Leucobacter celer]
MRARQAVPSTLRDSPVVAVLRAAAAEDYAPVVEALLTGGVRHVEVTLSTPGTLEAVPGLLARFGADARIGVGTVTDPDQARRAVEAGAHFLVTPTTDSAVIDTAVSAGLPVFPGGFTPTELHSGWSRGAAAVKVFPASQLGPGYLADLRGPFPGIEVIPSGGVTADDAIDWLRAGACAVSLGGPLLRDAFRGGDPAQLVRRAGELMARIRDARLEEER